jgi:hypothetical protein
MEIFMFGMELLGQVLDRLLDQQDHKVQKVLKDQQVVMVPKVQRVHRVCKVLQEKQVLKDQKDQQVLQEKTVLKA